MKPHFITFLSLLSLAAQAQVPPLPAVLPPKPPGVYYLTATAHNTNGTSDYSVELAYTNWLKQTSLLLGWDYPYPEAEPVTFTIHKGRQSGVYTNYYYVGTNREALIPLPPPTPSNCIVTLWASCTNWPSLTLTNLQGKLFFRPNWTKSGTKYTVRAECADSLNGSWSTWSWWPSWETNGFPQVAIYPPQKRYE